MERLPDPADLPQRQPHSVVAELLPSRGLRVLDVGCGGGRWMPLFADGGAIVTGIDVNADKVEAARRLDAGETHVGDAESLPFRERSFDIVLFMNSLHHIRVEGQTAALEEALRVLEPGGKILVLEPIAAGSNFEVRKPVDDETSVRAAALAAIRAVVAGGRARLAAEVLFTTVQGHESLDAFLEPFLAADPASRRKLVDAHRAVLDERFHKFGRRSHEGYRFDQPYRASLLISQ